MTHAYNVRLADLDRDVSALQSSVASLNDIVAELVVGLADGDATSRGWAHAAVAALEKSSRDLGYRANVAAAQIAHWKDEA